MASTNKTINYNLSQYTANDKPTYLVDYNSDMNKIDTQMKANSDLAGLAKTEADDLSSRVDGQDVIIGNLNTTVGQHTTDISTLNTDVSAVNKKVGDLTNLNTTDKTDIVNAVNEVNTKVGDLTNLTTTAKSNVVSAVNELNSDIDKQSFITFNDITSNDITFNVTNGSAPSNLQHNIHIYRNSDDSLVKILGNISFTNNGTGIVKIATPLRPSKTLTLKGHAIRMIYNSNNNVNTSGPDITLDTNGVLSINYIYALYPDDVTEFILFDSVIHIKDLEAHTS